MERRGPVSGTRRHRSEPPRPAAGGGAGDANPFQFAGGENDGSGLYFNRARYYSLTFQRFISEDPIGLAGGDVNLYAYVYNSPTDFADPSGNFPWANVGTCVVGGGIELGVAHLTGRKNLFDLHTWTRSGTWKVSLASASSEVRWRVMKTG